MLLPEKTLARVQRTIAKHAVVRGGFNSNLLYLHHLSWLLALQHLWLQSDVLDLCSCMLSCSM